jgi:hypothetical protein
MSKNSLLTALTIAMICVGVADAAPHSWCGQVAPGRGLHIVRTADTDRMCGFIQAQHTGPTTFTPSIPGTKVWIARQRVTGPVQLKAQAFYSILIEAPRSEDFSMSWDQPLGIPMEIAPLYLYQPVATVRAPCTEVLS